ncbi:MAG: hypothetical protein PHS34_08595 [Candidatus Omnitrophica bacterium]|nr:hypothetical protein [Candidatus Omnitrophota bacterium]
MKTQNDKAKLNKIKNLAKEGLWTDGEHHKQWFLEEIAKITGVSEKWMEEHTWARGIAP